MFEALRDAVGVVMAWIIAVVVAMCIVAGLTVVGLKIDGWLAPAQGDAQQKIQNNDANNRATAQDAFNQLDNTIKGDVVKIHNDKDQFGDHPTDPGDKAQLALDKATCVQAVNEYNTDANDMNMKDWRPAEDPPSFSLDICQ